MSLYSPAPPARPFSEDKTTLLVCWWITLFCATFILLRVTGRLIRVEKLFREDTIAAAALFPLFVRMAFVHVVLLYGTNNVDLSGIDGIAFSEGALQRRSIGSRLVLLSRIFDAATLWTLKAATLEFFRRLNGLTKAKSSARAIMVMRGTLVATFLAVVISTLAECQPITHSWQVSPDPGAKCRQGYANLLTMAVCNVLTDLLLVLYPIPVILASRIPARRKAFLIGLFCLGIVTAIISIYRVPKILAEDGYQATRSMWASVELIVATVAANTLALASFVRDLGVKKAKFKFDPVSSGKSERRAGHHAWPGHDLDRRVLPLGNAADCESRNKQGLFGVSQPERSGDMRDSESAGERASSPNRSQDSLIPRDLHLSPTNQVTKTTEIQVTVEDIGSRELPARGTHDFPAPGLTGMRTGPAPTVVAGNRGQVRGSTTVLKDMDALPKDS